MTLAPDPEPPPPAFAGRGQAPWMAARPRLAIVVWAAAVGAIAAAIAAQSVQIATGSAETATGYTLGGVTVYEGTVTAFDIRTEVLPGCTCQSANMTLSTGAPDIYFDSSLWPILPAIQVGDHVLAWVTCDGGECTAPPGAWAIKVTSPRATATSDVAQYSDVNFTPGSTASSKQIQMGLRIVAGLLGFLVLLILLLGEPSRLTAVAVVAAMIAVIEGHSFFDILTNLVVVFLGAAAAVGFGLAAWQKARIQRRPPGQYTVVASVVGAAMLGVCAVTFVIGAMFGAAG